MGSLKAPVQLKTLLAAVLAVALCLACQAPCACKVVYVNASRPDDSGDGLSWGTAKQKVASGLAVAVSGDEVWVAAGTYAERITLKSGVALYGGFIGAETGIDERNWNANATVLDGNKGGRVVTSPSGATATTRIDGFTIQHGTGSSGGGIYCDNSSPTITNNNIVANLAMSGYSDGGGIYCNNASPAITNNIIKANGAARYGGGIACSNSSPLIANNTMLGNYVSAPIAGETAGGGGICCNDNSSPAIASNSIKGNSASTYGGGIHCDDGSSPTITGNLIASNVAGLLGGGICCGNSMSRITNNTVAINSAPNGGGIAFFSSSPVICNNIVALNSSGIYSSSSTPTLRNNGVYNPDGYNYSGLSAGTGDKSADPGFATIQYGNYHIQPDSPCVDAGWNGASGIGTTDIDGQPRILPAGGTVDIGADESDGTQWSVAPLVVRIDGVNGNDANDGSTWALAKKSVQAGVDAVSGSGGEIWVEAGTYVGQVTLQNHAYLYGGFAGTESTRDARNWSANPTILDGGGLGSVVTASSMLYGFSTIDGFTIRNGKADYAGGIYCNNACVAISNNLIAGNIGTGIYYAGSGSSITNNTITGNTADHSAGGIQLAASSPAMVTDNTITGNSSKSDGGGICGGGLSSVIAHNVIVGNSAKNGGGLRVGSATVANNTIRGNTASGSGGGIYCSYSSPIVANNIVASNRASTGGGIYCDNASPTITNNTIATNSAYNYGGGISCRYSSAPVISNNIVAFNASGIYSSDSTPALRNNNVYGHSAYDYSGLSAGTGDISVDPELASIEYGDYHIQPGSPCVDAGWNGAAGIGTEDIDGQPRILPVGGTVDIGADESDGTYWTIEPAVVHVDGANGDDANDGSTWALAKKTAQAGIDMACVLGGEVWVKAGIYRERITLKPNCYLYGGFAGAESARDDRDWSANETILDGGGGPGAVVYGSGIVWQLAAVDGFTVRNGEGGVRATNSSLRISNNTITGNSSSGVYCDSYYSAPPSLIANNTIAGNRGSYGGGIGCSSTAAIVTNNSIVGNSATKYGGGLWFANSPSIVADNIVVGNGALYDGGGIDCSNSSATITNNTVSSNIATGCGGISCREGSSPVISGNIVALNSSGILSSGTGVPVLRSNDVYNPDGYDYSGLSAGTGDISADPKFASVQYGNYHIQPGSPCVDAGWNDAPDIGAADIDGQPRVMPAGGNADIGADESDGTTWDVTLPIVVRVDGADGNDAWDGSTWPLAKKTVQAGIDAASASGGEVWVKTGTYNEQITLGSYAYVYGGFAGSESTRDARNWSANVTILDGGGGNASVVTAWGTGFRQAAVDGFTIRNSTRAGITCAYGSPTVSNNTITGITTSGNAALVCVCDSSVISNNWIVGNAASGISCQSSRCTISNNTIAGNTGSSVRGLYCSFSYPTISNSIIACNASGIYQYSGAPVLRNNNVYNPDGQDYYGLSAGVGDISADPRFASHLSGNYHIQPDSPCVDAGWNEAPCIGAVDADGQPRILPLDGIVDIGADESDGTVWDDALALVVRVDGVDGDDGNDGSSWPLAKKTVQAAIDTVSLTAGEVWVKASSYHERVILKTNAFVYGGFAGTESARHDRDWFANPTILDGDSVGSVVTASGIAWGHGGIDGFTIRNGRATNGGGVFCSGASAAFSNNTITRNTANSSGGGICITSTARSSPVVSGNTITGNSASDGGGIYCSCLYGSVTISRNVIKANTVTSKGGGVYAGVFQSPSGFAVQLSSNRISNNSAASSGGGLYVGNWTSATMSGNMITGNSAGAYGGGLYCSNCYPTMSNNTLAANGAPSGGGGMYMSASSSANLANNIVALNSSGIYFSGGSPTLRNNDVYNPGGYDYSGVSAGTGDMSGDPRFVSPEYGDFHIQPDSPCVDAGWNEAPNMGATDIDGQRRILPVGGTVDMGADESDGTAKEPPVPVVVRVDGEDGDDSNDGSTWPLAKKTVQSAIDAASASGGEVWVRSGVFNERITLRPHAYVFGGFAGTESDRSGRNWAANETVLDGGGAGSVVTALAAWQLSGIDGFTIRNGEATYGGGVYCAGSSPAISNNIVTGNSATTGGGGIYCSASCPTISGNLVVANTANSYGGGVYCTGSSPTLSGNTITRNSSSGSGGAVYCTFSSPAMSNNIAAFNSSGLRTSAGSPTLRSNDVYNPGGTNYSGLSAGVGDISLDPVFVDKDRGNYHLTASSPCVDAGWNDAPGMPTLDFDGQTRIRGGTVDIGADEYWPTIADAKTTDDGEFADVSGEVVTASFADFFYIESAGRTSGIRVEKAAHGIPMWARADVAGTAQTNADGERFIAASSVSQTGVGRVAPLAMNNAWLGGGPFGLQEGVWGWRVVIGPGGPERVWAPACGLNNIGLLVRVCGRVLPERTTADSFTIDDGAAVCVKCVVPEGVEIDPGWTCVSVTGACSCEKAHVGDHDELHPVVRVRTQGDIAPL